VVEIEDAEASEPSSEGRDDVWCLARSSVSSSFAARWRGITAINVKPFAIILSL
jgi:hypothetical protein